MASEVSSREERREKIARLKQRLYDLKARVDGPSAEKPTDQQGEPSAEEATNSTGAAGDQTTRDRYKNNRQCPPAAKSSTGRAAAGANSIFGEECRKHVEEKMKTGMSRKEARREWIHMRVTERIEAKRRAIEDARKAEDEERARAENAYPRTDMTLRETAGMRVPLPARMPGETAETYERREIQAAEDFIDGKYDVPDEEEKKAEEKRVIKAKRRVRWQIDKQVLPALYDIDWKTVVQRRPVRKFLFPPEMVATQPTPHAIYAALTLHEFEKTNQFKSDVVHGYPWGYLKYLREILGEIDNPWPLEDLTTARYRIKLAYLEALAAKMTEDWEWAQTRLGGAALTRAGEETKWKLQLLQGLANPMAVAVWEAARERDYERGHGKAIVYRDGLPVDLWAPVPRLTQGRWKTRKGVVCLWSPCLQCKVAGAGECSSARFMAKKPRTCHRCQRQGLPCVRGDDDSSEESLAEKGVERWETYRPADPTSMTTEEAQGVARELLETRGRRFVNVCGVMVDEEDAKGFAPPVERGVNIYEWRNREEEGQGEERWVSKAVMARGDEFVERMKVLKCDEYWLEKASTGESVMMDFDGVTGRYPQEVNREGIPAKLMAI
jgi:hypothetical protein